MRGFFSLLKKMSFAFLFFIFLLSGCGENPAETIYEHLEKAVVLEEMFKEQQAPLVEAEQKEHEIYEQIISLGIDEFDEIVRLSQEALIYVNKRYEMIDKEKSSIEAGYNEFNKITSEHLEKLDEEVVEAFNKLKETMDNRYKAYQTLYQNYKNALDLDKQLYEMLQQEDLTMEALQAHIDKINASYEEVLAAKEEFNQYTEQYNELKEEFYKKTNLNVEIVQ